MKRYWEYFKYIIRHKIAVFQVGYAMGIPLRVLIMHDLSKLRPFAEFIPYAKAFYNEHGEPEYTDSPEFDRAWLEHQHANPHHWEYWVLVQLDDDTLTTSALEIPPVYVKEMAADIIGSGKSIDNALSALDYLNKIDDRIAIHPISKIDLRQLVYHYNDYFNHKKSTQG